MVVILRAGTRVAASTVDTPLSVAAMFWDKLLDVSVALRPLIIWWTF
jgi:hypothetical protein